MSQRQFRTEFREQEDGTIDGVRDLRLMSFNPDLRFLQVRSAFSDFIRSSTHSSQHPQKI